MKCKEPACPWPSAREGLCTQHWKLHHGTREDLLMGPAIPPDAGPKWTPGLTNLIKPDRRRQISGRKGAEAMLRGKGLR
jgi:hypothetical protein